MMLVKDIMNKEKYFVLAKKNKAGNTIYYRNKDLFSNHRTNWTKNFKRSYIFYDRDDARYHLRNFVDTMGCKILSVFLSVEKFEEDNG